MSQYEFIDGFIKRETMSATSKREDEHGGGGVEAVPGGKEFVPRLEDRSGEGGCIS